MAIWLDGNFWSHYFDETFISRINAFCEVIINRVLPTFANIEREAEQVAQAEYERLGSLPAADDSYVDLVGVAEEAQEAGIVYYETISNLRQAIINLGAVGLHHTFEQQLLLFHRRQVLHPSQENDKSEISIEKLKQKLGNGGMDITRLQSWSKVDELRIVANSIKHAEGSAVEQLRKRRADLFEHPNLKESDLSSFASSPAVYLPLAGQDIYLTVGDLKDYQTAVVSFWKEFGGVIREHRQRK